MKRILLALTRVLTCAALAGAPTFALAQAPAAPSAQEAAAVKDLMDAMDVRKMMLASFTEMEKALPQMMRSQVAAVVNADPSASDEKKQAALARIEQVLPGAAAAVNRMFRDPALVDEMMAEIGPLYARNYSVDELKQLAAFYRTPLGRKMLALSPRLAAESMAVGQKIVAPRLNGLMLEVMQDAQAK